MKEISPHPSIVPEGGYSSPEDYPRLQDIRAEASAMRSKLDSFLTEHSIYNFWDISPKQMLDTLGKENFSILVGILTKYSTPLRIEILLLEEGEEASQFEKPQAPSPYKFRRVHEPHDEDSALLKAVRDDLGRVTLWLREADSKGIKALIKENE